MPTVHISMKFLWMKQQPIANTTVGNLAIVIIRLMLSLWLWPRAITLSGFHCIKQNSWHFNSVDAEWRISSAQGSVARGPGFDSHPDPDGFIGSLISLLSDNRLKNNFIYLLQDMLCPALLGIFSMTKTYLILPNPNPTLTLILT